MRLLLFVLVAVTCTSCICQVVSNYENGLLDQQIDGLRKLLADNADQEGYKLINSDLWRRLGILLQSKDIRHHQGGGKLQPEALEAFNNALRLDENRTMSTNIQVNYLKGILLKMMGFGRESLHSLDIAQSYKLTHEDLSSVYYHKGEAYLMLGEIDNAASHYRKSIKLAPCKTDRYYSYVQACKELKGMTKQRWVDLMTEIHSVMKSCQAMVETGEELEVDFSVYDAHLKEKGKGATRTNKGKLNSVQSSVDDGGNYDDEDDDDEDYEEEDYSLISYLQLSESEIGASSIENSAVYWALYIAAEKAERYSLAWRYLDRANSIERSRRELKYHKEDTRVQLHQITSVFQKGFWDSLPDMSGDSSTVPIFIIGMMRSGSTLLETMLDSHGQIWGMGEDSIFNGNLTYFRDALVQASSAEGTQSDRMTGVEEVLQQYGSDTVRKMHTLAVAKIEGTSGSDSGTKEKSRNIKHIVDKMLFNYRNIGFLHLVYPDALIIHTVRDPMDTLFSCYRNKFDDHGLEWSLDVKDLVQQYVAYLEIMAHFRKVLPGRVVDLRYEDLISDPEKIMRDLVETRLGLQWNPQVLNFHTSNRTVHTHSQSQVRQSIYKHSVGSWRRYAQQLQPMIDELNKFLPKLRKSRSLPFVNNMNWALDPVYDYSDSASGSGDATTKRTTTAAVNNAKHTGTSKTKSQDKTKRRKVKSKSVLTSCSESEGVNEL